MRCPIQTLTFDLLDDISLGVESGVLEVPDIPPTRADALGPLLELRHVLAEDALNAVWLNVGTYADLLENIASAEAWFQPGIGDQGFVSIAKLQRDDLAWTDFSIRAKRAALTAGFTDDYGGKLIAAIGEFYSNVVEHSQRIDTGYIVYAAQAGQFEFVIADGGIGVLKSLQTNPKFAPLSDPGSALEYSLSEGVSRHYEEKGHGYGFRPLFVGLANISRFMRFRSSDHSREVTRKYDGNITARTIQKSHLTGFLCSVLCEVQGKISQATE